MRPILVSCTSRKRLGLFCFRGRSRSPSSIEMVRRCSCKFSDGCRSRHVLFDISVETGKQTVRETDMTRRQNILHTLQSISGGTFIGLGLHTLSGNLSGDATHLRHLLGIPAGEGLGVLSSVALAASRASRVYALDHQGFLDSLRPLLASCWPIVLVIVGAMLLRDALTDRVKAPPADESFRNKYFGNADARCRFRCPSFDV